MLDAAVRYARRGWSVIPIPHRSKNPGTKGWQQLRLKEPELAESLNGAQQNIGVLLGEPSGWLIDVDLDHQRAIELAPQYLPETPAVFGRAGKPRSHYLFRAGAPLATKKHKSKSAGMIVESEDLSPQERAERCLAAMLRMHMIDHNDGSSRLFAAACRVVEHDLNDRDGITAIGCEQTGRKAFLMELDQAYADIIVQRFETFSGKKAELVQAAAT